MREITLFYTPLWQDDFADNHAHCDEQRERMAVHTHPDSLLSGVVSSKANSVEQGTIQFFFCREASPTTHWNRFAPLEARTTSTDDTYSVTPREGLILFFPSRSKHWVTPNLTDDGRVSLSFNIRAE